MLEEISDGATHVEAHRAPPPVATTSNPTERFNLVHLQEMGEWLIGRLRERFPSRDDRALMTYLRGYISNNETLFLRKGEAVALARVAHSPFLPCRVEELFVLTRSGDKAEAGALYDDIRRWAESLDAMEIVVERFTDVPRGIIKDVVGRVKSRDVSFVSLPIKAEAAKAA